MHTLRTLAFSLAGLATLGSAVAQDADQIHPRTMINFGFGVGDQTLETNTGDLALGVASRSTDAFHFRFRGEHFFRSDFGVFANVYFGTADDINEDLGSAESSLDSFGVHVAVAYRALMDDDFRLPVRFGPFVQMLEYSFDTQPFGDTDYSTIGVRLSAEPEYIITQSTDGGRVSELSAFAEISCGAGPTEVEDDVSSEDGYAFTLSYEFGVRYRLGNGLMGSLSWFAQKEHIGATESYNNAVFFGVDNDFNGILIGLGYRF